MRIYYLYENYILFDNSIKFKILSSFFCNKKFYKMTANSSDFLQNSFKYRIIPIFFLLFGLFSFIPKHTFVKKPVSSFRTTRGDLIGYKLTLRSKHFFLFFEKFLTKIQPFLSRIGYKHTFNLSNTGVGTFGIQNLKTFELFTKSQLRYISYDLGFDFSINMNFFDKNGLNKSSFFLSSFQHLIFNNKKYASKHK
jgi:ribosomal protein L5